MYRKVWLIISMCPDLYKSTVLEVCLLVWSIQVNTMPKEEIHKLWCFLDCTLSILKNRNSLCLIPGSDWFVLCHFPSLPIFPVDVLSLCQINSVECWKQGPKYRKEYQFTRISGWTWLESVVIKQFSHYFCSRLEVEGSRPSSPRVI